MTSEDKYWQILYNDWVHYIREDPSDTKIENCKICQKDVVLEYISFSIHLRDNCAKNVNKLDCRTYFIRFIY